MSQVDVRQDKETGEVEVRKDDHEVGNKMRSRGEGNGRIVHKDTERFKNI